MLGFHRGVRYLQFQHTVNAPSQVAQVVKSPAATAGDAGNTGDMGSTPESGRSPGGGNGILLQYSCLENLMDRAIWWATVHGIAESDTTDRLHTHMFPFTLTQCSSAPVSDNRLENHRCKQDCGACRWKESYSLAQRITGSRH